MTRRRCSGRRKQHQNNRAFAEQFQGIPRQKTVEADNSSLKMVHRELACLLVSPDKQKTQAQ